MQDKLKNLSESHEDSNANSIDTDDALDIADLSSKQPIVSVAQYVVLSIGVMKNFFFVSCLPCQRGYHNAHVMDKRMKFLLLDILIIIICSCRCKFLKQYSVLPT